MGWKLGGDDSDDDDGGGGGREAIQLRRIVRRTPTLSGGESSNAGSRRRSRAVSRAAVASAPASFASERGQASRAVGPARCRTVAQRSPSANRCGMLDASVVALCTRCRAEAACADGADDDLALTATAFEHDLANTYPADAAALLDAASRDAAAGLTPPGLLADRLWPRWAASRVCAPRGAKLVRCPRASYSPLPSGLCGHRALAPALGQSDDALDD